MTRRDYVSEIEAKRGRNRLYPVAAPLRIRFVKDAVGRVGKDAELLRYFPVALVAIVETFVRKAVQELIDHRPQALDGFLSSASGKDQKFDLTILRAIAGKRISVGELVGHLIPIKSIEHIEAIMTAVLGVSFFSVLKTVQDRWAVEVEGKSPEPIIPDLDAVLALLADVYRNRHILAHEDPEGYELSAEQVERHVDAVAAFLDAAAEVVGNTIHPNAPLTQGAMNRDAADAAFAVEDALTEQVTSLRAALPPSMQEALDASQRAWLVYRDAQARLEGLEVAGGSMQPMIESSARETLARKRAEDLARVFVDVPDGLAGPKGLTIP